MSSDGRQVQGGRDVFERLKRKSLMIAACTMGLTAPAMAQESCSYPEKPVSVVVGYSAGGGTDIVARLLTSMLPEFANGQSFNVINKPGGAQVPAMRTTLNARKDGYTLQFFSAGSLVLAGMLQDLDLNFYDTFQPAGMVSAVASAIAVNNESPVTNATELVDWIRESAEKGEKLRWGHSGRGAFPHVGGLAWLMANDLDDLVQDVPFEGSAKSRAALIGGQIDFAVVATSNVEEFKDQIRGIGQIHEERDQVVSWLPSLAEQGTKVISVESPLLLAAPKGVPDEVIACLETAIGKVAETEAFRTAMNKAGFGVTFRNSADTMTMMESRRDTWQPIADEIKAGLGN